MPTSPRDAAPPDPDAAVLTDEYAEILLACVKDNQKSVKMAEDPLRILSQYANDIALGEHTANEYRSAIAAVKHAATSVNEELTPLWILTVDDDIWPFVNKLGTLSNLELYILVVINCICRTVEIWATGDVRYMCLYPSGRRESLERRCICTANLFFLVFLFHCVLHFLLKDLLCDAWRSVYWLMITYAEVCRRVAFVIIYKIVGSRNHVSEAEPYTRAMGLLCEDAANPTVHSKMLEAVDKLEFGKSKFVDFTKIVATIRELALDGPVAQYNDDMCSVYREAIKELKGKPMVPLDSILKTDPTAASLSLHLNSTLWFFL